MTALDLALRLAALLAGAAALLALPGWVVDRLTPPDKVARPAVDPDPELTREDKYYG